MVKRRDALKGIGASILTAGLGGVGSARAGGTSGGPPGTTGVKNNRELPIHADGKKIHRFVRDPDADGEFTLHRTFRSPDLARRYGDPDFDYEPLSVPEQQVPEEVRTGQQTTFVAREQQVIGTVAEHRKAERLVHERMADGDSDVHPLHIPTLDGNVPLYHYQNQSDAQNLQNRGAPLNVAWETEDAQSIKTHMENGDGGGTWLPGHIILAVWRESRWVNLPNGGTKSNDVHVMRWIPNAICTTRQYHIRIYDVPFDDVAAIGQAHRDPCDHGLTPGLSTNFRLDEARDAVADFWKDGHSNINYETTFVGNTSNDFSSHSGTWAYFDEA